MFEIIRMFLLASLTIGPAVLWVKFVIDRQPTVSVDHKLIGSVFAIGMISIIPAVIFGIVLKSNNPFVPETLYYMIADEFICVAFVEEMCKWISMMLISTNCKNRSNKYDYIVLAVASSMGFAMVENIFYVFNAKHSFMVAISRMFLSVPSHMCYAVFMGCFCGLFSESIRKNRIIESMLFIALSVFVPVLLHGSNNLLLEMGMLLMSIVQDVVVLICALRIIFVIAKRTDNKKIKFVDRFSGMLFDLNTIENSA